MNETKWNIEYFENFSGKCPVQIYIEELEVSVRAKVLRTIELLEDFGPELPMPFSKHARGKIWELRVSHERILYYIYTGKKIILLHGFAKKTNKIHMREILTAEKRLKEFERRNKS